MATNLTKAIDVLVWYLAAVLGSLTKLALRYVLEGRNMEVSPWWTALLSAGLGTAVMPLIYERLALMRRQNARYLTPILFAFQAGFWFETLLLAGPAA